MGNLLRRLARRHAPFLVASGLLLAGFELIVGAITSTVDVRGALPQIVSSLPPFLRDVLGNQLAAMTPGGLIAFGWNHPVALALGTAVGILLAARSVAGEIESGTLELVLAQPISRATYLGAQVVFGLAAVIAIALAGLAGTVAGGALFRGPSFPVLNLAALALNFFLLHAAWYAVTLILSVSSRQGGRVATTAFLVALFSYLVATVARLWGRAAFLLPWTLHGHYWPQEALALGLVPLRSLTVLTAAIAAGLLAAAWRFPRRDVP